MNFASGIAHKFLDSRLADPFLSLYTSISHNRAIKFLSHPIRLDSFILSIGNITFGGTGKTPLTRFLATELIKSNLRIGIVYRGWKSEIDRKNLPPQIISGENIPIPHWKFAGDEPVLMAEYFDGKIPIAVGRDRIAASKLLIDKFQTDILLLDDGFQYTKLFRNLNIVLIDSIQPWGRIDGTYGVLRESPDSLSRADLIIISRAESVTDSRINSIRSTLYKNNIPPEKIIVAKTSVSSIHHILTDSKISEKNLVGEKIGIIAGIGNPNAFEYTAKSLGAEIVHSEFFPDHHPFRSSELSRFISKSSRYQASILLTTSKDAIRLRDIIPSESLPLYILDIETNVSGGVFKLTDAIGGVFTRMK